MLAYWARFHVNVGPSTQATIPFSEYQIVGGPLLLIMMVALFSKGAYRKRLSMELVHELGIVASASTIGVAVIVVLTFMLHQLEYSRGVIVYLWLFLLRSEEH